MRLYTFVLEYQGGTYIYQRNGRTLEDGLAKWAANLPIEKIEAAGPTFEADLEAGIVDILNNAGISSINGVSNVWCCTFIASDSLGIVTIIATDSSVS
jgi:hypothetical protein